MVDHEKYLEIHSRILEEIRKQIEALDGLSVSDLVKDANRRSRWKNTQTVAL